MKEEVNHGEEGCPARKHKRFKRPTKCVVDVVRHFSALGHEELTTKGGDDSTMTVESHESKHVPKHEAKKSDENVEEVLLKFDTYNKPDEPLEELAARQSYLANMIPSVESFEHRDTSFVVSRQMMDQRITNFILEYHCLLERIEVAESALGKAHLSQARMEQLVAQAKACKDGLKVHCEREIGHLRGRLTKEKEKVVRVESKLARAMEAAKISRVKETLDLEVLKFVNALRIKCPNLPVTYVNFKVRVGPMEDEEELVEAGKISVGRSGPIRKALLPTLNFHLLT
nr:hypothetical protein [Tanacetum cinerariifolium]